MRALIVALMLCSAVQAAELEAPKPVTAVKDVLLTDSLYCNDPQTLLITKEKVLSKYVQRDISDIVQVMKTAQCDVQLDKEVEVEIRRSAYGRLIGIGGEPETEILVEVFHNGELLGWTESVNLKNSALQYERMKKNAPLVRRAVINQ